MSDKKDVKVIITNIEKLLDELTPEERLQVFSKYCQCCGDKNPECQCWNDD